jgi:hypothetical protein
MITSPASLVAFARKINNSGVQVKSGAGSRETVKRYRRINFTNSHHFPRLRLVCGGTKRLVGLPHNSGSTLDRNPDGIPNN